MIKANKKKAKYHLQYKLWHLDYNINSVLRSLIILYNISKIIFPNINQILEFNHSSITQAKK